MHLRIVNHKDAVTAIPDGLNPGSAVCGRNLIFRPIGIELRLYKNQEKDPRFHSPRVKRTPLAQFVYDMSGGLKLFSFKFLKLPCELFQQNYMQWHSCEGRRGNTTVIV